MSRLRSAKFRRPLEISEADLAMPSGDRGPNLLPNYADWSSLADDELYRVQLRHRLVAALIELPPIYRASPSCYEMSRGCRRPRPVPS